jgi:hypothetical protein
MARTGRTSSTFSISFEQPAASSANASSNENRGTEERLEADDMKYTFFPLLFGLPGLKFDETMQRFAPDLLLTQRLVIIANSACAGVLG